MTDEQRFEAAEAACKLFYASAPTETNANRCLDLLEILRDSPELFWDRYHYEVRREAVEQLYLASYGYVTKQCLAESILTYDDTSMILEGLARHLPSYDGDLSLNTFQAWASDAIKPAIAFYAMRREYSAIVRKGAWSIVRSAVDLGYDDDTIPAIESRVWEWVLTSRKSPLVPGSGTGRISTRLFGKARILARAWKKTQLLRRERLSALSDVIRADEGEARRQSQAVAKTPRAKRPKKSPPK